MPRKNYESFEIIPWLNIVFRHVSYMTRLKENRKTIKFTHENGVLGELKNIAVLQCYDSYSVAMARREHLHTFRFVDDSIEKLLALHKYNFPGTKK